MENPLNEETVQALMEIGSTYALKVLGAIALLIIGRIVAGWARKMVRRALQKSKVDPAVQGFLATAAFLMVQIFAVLAALDLFGVETASIVGILAAAGFAVGMALQGSLSHFAAGILLLVFRPFKVGDFIEAAGVMGDVEEIQIFNTIVNGPNNVRHIIPNGQIYSSVIKNYTANDFRRVDVTAGIGYSSDIGAAKSILLELMQNDPRTLSDPEPMVAVSSLGDSSVNILARSWVKHDDWWDVQFDLNENLKLRFDAAGIEIPFPQRSVHMVREEA